MGLALHKVVSNIKKVLAAKKITLAAFVNVKGAFDNTTSQSIHRVLANRGTNPLVLT